jgi:hypothetical protein
VIPTTPRFKRPKGSIAGALHSEHAVPYPIVWSHRKFRRNVKSRINRRRV